MSGTSSLHRHVRLACAGTAVLPRLFVASLPVTLVAAPAASAFLGRQGVSRDRTVHQLYRLLAASFVGERSGLLSNVVIVHTVGNDQVRSRLGDPWQ